MPSFVSVDKLFLALTSALPCRVSYMVYRRAFIFLSCLSPWTYLHVLWTKLTGVGVMVTSGAQPDGGHMHAHANPLRQTG